MAEVTFKTKSVHTNGALPKVGTKAPDFQLAGQDLSDISLQQFGDKVKLLNIFPSLDTSVCSLALKKFYEQCKSHPDLALLNISLDLPFAAARFCQEHKLANAVTLSAFRSSFPEDYGVRLTDGPLKGLTARAVLLLNGENKVIYQELVAEITQEPDYSAVFDKIPK